MTREALGRLRLFERRMREMYDEFGIDICENLGRRNGIVSQAQERFFSDVLSRQFPGIIVDGRTGQADIVLPSIGRELECKITSGSGARRSWALQTDYATLVRKAELDFLYVLAAPEFDRFAVLHFEGLTPDDFSPPAAGAREKARMIKHRAMDRCTVLWGDVTCRNDVFISDINSKRRELDVQWEERLGDLDSRIDAAHRAPARRAALSRSLESERENMRKRAVRLTERLDYWRSTPNQYSFTLQEV
tara:strand:+ start:51 stop:794 length:744 start_codon:yes stop_codon:yes gene_type:complete